MPGSFLFVVIPEEGLGYLGNGARRILVPTTRAANRDRVLKDKYMVYPYVEGKQPIGEYSRNAVSRGVGGNGLTVLTGETPVSVDDENLPHRHRVFDLYALTH